MPQQSTSDPAAATLLEHLQQADPSITSLEADVFRSCLVAVAVELNQQKDTALQLSLLQWWQWLDQEGYDRDMFATILGRLCTNLIDAQGWDDLLAHCRSSAQHPDGLPALLEHLQACHPELYLLLEDLEDQAQQEERQLMAVAGGMGKAGIIATSVSSVTVVVIVGTIAYCCWKARRRVNDTVEAIQQDPQRVLHQDTPLVEQAVQTHLRRQAANAVHADNATENQQLRQDAEAREANPERTSSEKLLLEFTEKDIQSAAIKLTENFFRTTEGRALGVVFGKLSPKKILKINSKYLDSPDFQAWYQDLHDTARFEKTEQAVRALQNWDRHPDFLRKIRSLEREAKLVQLDKISKSMFRGFVADLTTELSEARAMTDHLIDQAAKDECMSLNLDAFPEYQRFKALARAEERNVVSEADGLVIEIEEAATGTFRDV